MIHQQNWRNRYCEIDIVAEKDSTLFFVEVKYRARQAQGGGLEYVTPAKQRRMANAALAYCQEMGETKQYALAVASLSGSSLRMDEFIDELIVD